MSRTLAEHLELPPAPRRDEPADLGSLLEQVRDSAVRIARDLGHRPDVVRVSAGAVSVEVRWSAAAAPPAAVPVPVAEVVAVPAEVGPVVTAPAVGVFHPAPEPGAAPFVAVGDLVRPGTQVGIVEAMKLMMPVTAEVTGRVAAVLKRDGEPVEYGEPLFTLLPADRAAA
ncbi:MAG: Biotin carboxyl carrier protein of acetyl-CoA carboxylase [uncultured Corynebacteriales bacterium]|uniref:Biotin carboxyl carrier protein of acetyl-CoA carboxylase n=1 Tax=uncultured Mycobacteriales bacterium TaxID=581187 RepID=A0A6J4IEH1_9ACTN|nr:MAG: Biotin carboxyl carrier protein of acetyl-CoA carboxylase [uncultured Corynebacteriales bacterium]